MVRFLKAERLRQGLSLRDLARRIDGPTRESSISQWENGLKAPSFDRFADWANALDFDVVLLPRRTRGEPPC